MNYTTIEQSKKLMELGLNPDTADMYWATDANVVIAEPYITKTEYETQIPAYKGAIPCWSVGALFNLMPRVGAAAPILVKSLEGDKYIAHYHGIGTYKEVNTTDRYDSVIDACYEMVVWLLKNNYIK